MSTNPVLVWSLAQPSVYVQDMPKKEPADFKHVSEKHILSAFPLMHREVGFLLRLLQPYFVPLGRALIYYRSREATFKPSGLLKG